MTLVGEIDQTVQDGVGQRGDGVVERATVPLNPFKLASVIVELPLAPEASTTVVGLAEMEKSGLPEDTIVNATLTLWDTLPPAPVTVTV